MASPATKQHHHQARLLGNQDLLAYYNLIPIYNKYVRPYPPPDRGASLDQSLQSYIADLPGKTAFDPNVSLFNILRDPQIPEQGPPIKPFDADVLREAYSLKPGPIPGYDSSILGADDGGSSSAANTGQYLGIDRDAYGVSAGEGDTGGERKHKKKKKKRKHSHEHDDENHSHSEHKKKKKRKKQSSSDQQETPLQQPHPM